MLESYLGDEASSRRQTEKRENVNSTIHFCIPNHGQGPLSVVFV
jgi:hypothetical protein